MTDMAEGESGAGRAWTKGAAAQKGHASKRSPGVISHPRVPFSYPVIASEKRLKKEFPIRHSFADLFISMWKATWWKNPKVNTERSNDLPLLLYLSSASTSLFFQREGEARGDPL
jgi:hypothetical protein